MRLLDTFCKAGGAGMGYWRAGFEVVGVDHEPQPNYPFTFVLADALEYIMVEGATFDVVHASPPCHDHSDLSSLHGKDGTEHLLNDSREILQGLGIPYVIENVGRAKMLGATVLCGSMFDLGAHCRDGIYRQLRRHRQFESNIPLSPPRKCSHAGHPVGVYGNGGRQAAPRNRGYMGAKQERFDAMGIDWMSHKEVAQAIPPAYTEHVGRQLLAAMSSGREDVAA